MIPASVLLFIFSILTLGLGFYIFPILFFLVSALYFGVTVGGEYQATPGMRLMGIIVIRDDGQRLDFISALIRMILFWIFNALLTPFILLVGLFTERNRLLHDILPGMAVRRMDI